MKDPYTVPPTLIKPPAPRKEITPNDVTNFPEQKSVPIPEFIPYPVIIKSYLKIKIKKKSP